MEDAEIISLYAKATSDDVLLNAKGMALLVGVEPEEFLTRMSGRPVAALPSEWVAEGNRISARLREFLGPDVSLRDSIIYLHRIRNRDVPPTVIYDSSSTGSAGFDRITDEILEFLENSGGVVRDPDGHHIIDTIKVMDYLGISPGEFLESMGWDLDIIPVAK